MADKKKISPVPQQRPDPGPGIVPEIHGSEMVQVSGLSKGREYTFFAADISETIAKLMELKNELGQDVGSSGQIRLRMPKTLHATLTRLAETEGVSLNTYLVHLLSLQAGNPVQARPNMHPGNTHNLFVMSKKVMRISVNQQLHDYVGCSDIKIFSKD